MAPLRRRRVLRLTGAASVTSTTGCLGNLPGQSEDNDNDPPDEPENGTDAGDDDDAETELDIPECPEKPKSLTEEAVADYATQFEMAREVRLTLEDASDPVTKVSITTDKVEVTETDDGWEVYFERDGPHLQFDTEDYQNGGVIQRVAYYVTEDTTLRTASEEDFEETLEPQEDGEPVECPP